MARTVSIGEQDFGELVSRHVSASPNREMQIKRASSLGRYDVMLCPKQLGDDGIILEFKVYDPDGEASLEDTVQAALKQIEEKKYKQALLAQGVEAGKIRRYGFAFRGKEVLIG